MDTVISKSAFIAWKKDCVEVTGFEEDQKTKSMALMTLNAFITELTFDSDKENAGD